MAYEIVVIGASVGGLEAVSVFLAELGPRFSLPVAIAQHRAPAPPEGDIAAIWQRATPMAVADAEDKAPIVRRQLATRMAQRSALRANATSAASAPAPAAAATICSPDAVR